MKPMQTLPRCQRTTPWEHERHMEAQLYRDMGEEDKCNSTQVLGSATPYVVDEPCPSAKGTDVEPIVIDDI
jgi:hypothetical protein